MTVRIWFIFLTNLLNEFHTKNEYHSKFPQEVCRWQHRTHCFQEVDTRFNRCKNVDFTQEHGHTGFHVQRHNEIDSTNLFSDLMAMLGWWLMLLLKWNNLAIKLIQGLHFKIMVSLVKKAWFIHSARWEEAMSY